MGLVMFRLIRLYDTIVNDTSFRPSTRVPLDVAKCDCTFISISTPLARSTTPTSVYGIPITALVITGLAVAIVEVVHLSWLAYLSISKRGTLPARHAHHVAVDPQHHTGWTMAIAASELHRNTIYPVLGHNTPSLSIYSIRGAFVSYESKAMIPFCELWYLMLYSRLHVAHIVEEPLIVRVIIVLLRQRLSHLHDSCVLVNRRLPLPSVL